MFFFTNYYTITQSKKKKTCRENKEYTSSNNRPQPDLFWWHQLLEQFCFGFLFRTQSVVVRAQHNRDDGHDDEHFEDHHDCPPLTFQRHLMVVAVLLPSQVPFSSVDHFQQFFFYTISWTGMDVFFLAFLCKRCFPASSSWRYFSVARHLLLLYPLCIRLKAASVVTKEQWRLCFLIIKK